VSRIALIYPSIRLRSVGGNSRYFLVWDTYFPKYSHRLRLKILLSDRSNPDPTEKISRVDATSKPRRGSQPRNFHRRISHLSSSPMDRPIAQRRTRFRRDKAITRSTTIGTSSTSRGPLIAATFRIRARRRNFAINELQGRLINRRPGRKGEDKERWRGKERTMEGGRCTYVRS